MGRNGGGPTAHSLIHTRTRSNIAFFHVSIIHRLLSNASALRLGVHGTKPLQISQERQSLGVALRNVHSSFLMFFFSVSVGADFDVPFQELHSRLQSGLDR